MLFLSGGFGAGPGSLPAPLKPKRSDIQQSVQDRKHPLMMLGTSSLLPGRAQLGGGAGRGPQVRARFVSQQRNSPSPSQHRRSSQNSLGVTTAAFYPSSSSSEGGGGGGGAARNEQEPHDGSERPP